MKKIQVNISEIIAKSLDVDVSTISLDTSMLNNSKWDSLAHINIITSIEKYLGYQFKIDEIASIISVGDICELLNRDNL